MTALAFRGNWFVQFFKMVRLAEDVGLEPQYERSLQVDRLITEAPYTSPFTQLGRVYFTIYNLNHVNSYMDWESREQYRIRVLPRRDSASWADMHDARIVSYGTGMIREDGSNQIVYEMSWVFRSTEVNAFNFTLTEKAAPEDAALRWQEVGF